MPTSHFFPRQLETSPDALALTDLTRSRSWRNLDRNILALAGFLRQQCGLRPGDHVALLVGNRAEFFEAFLAGMLAGLWVTPVNTHLSPTEVDYILHDCGARIIFHDEDHAALIPKGLRSKAVNVVDTLPGLSLPDSEGAPGLKSPGGGGMLYTSGTTGRPKGVKRAAPDTVGEMISRMQNLGRSFGLTGRGVHLVTGPLYHAAPGMLALYDMLNGAPVVIMPRWQNDTFLRCVSEYRVTTTHLVPTMFVRLLDSHDQGLTDDMDLSSLEYVLHGAAPISRSVKQRMIDWWGPILTEYWGATESGTVTMADSEAWLAHPGTVGRPIANFEVFVGNEHGDPVNESEGLLFCRHRQLPQIFSYHNDPEKTRKAHPQPYVLSLGDIGRVDAEGYVYLSDRQSHMIISGGVNIYPAEVEQALLEHPQVVDAAVFGIPNREWGEEVKAVVQLCARQPGDPSTAEDIRSFLRGRIANFKIPRSIDFVEELPRNPTGKTLVRQLKERYRDQAATDE